jgi:hypothetical protein
VRKDSEEYVQALESADKFIKMRNSLEKCGKASEECGQALESAE